MTRSTKLLASLLFCALGAALAAVSLEGQVSTGSEPAETEADCEGRVLPRTGEWTIQAEEMQGPRVRGVGEGGLGTLTITSVPKCGRKIEVDFPEVGGSIVFEVAGEWEIPQICFDLVCEEAEKVFSFDSTSWKGASVGLSAEERKHVGDWLSVHMTERVEDVEEVQRLLTHRATKLPSTFEGVQWLLVVQSETQIRSFIYGGFNWQHHSWGYRGQ